MIKEFSIGKKTMIGGVALVCIPICLIGLFCMLTVSNNLLDISGGNMLAVAQNLADLCDLVLAEELKTAQVLGSGNTTIVRLMEAETSGKEKGKLSVMLAKKSKALGKHYEGLSVTDHTGKVIANDRTLNVSNLSVGDREYFKKAIKGEPNIGEVVMSKASGQPVLPIAAPLTDDSGKIHGVLLMILEADFLTEKIARTKIGETGFGVLLSDQGLTLAHPKNEYVLKLNISQSKNGEMDQVWQLVKKQAKGVAGFSLNGIKKIAGVAPLKIKSWSVTANQDEDELLHPAYRIRNAIMVVGGFFLVITIVLVTLYTRHLSLPMMNIAERARRLSLGNLKMHKTEQKREEKLVSRKDEIGKIARAFGALEAYMKEKADISVLIAEGDLNCQVKVSSQEDILGNSFERMIGNLKEIVSQVDDAAVQIDGGSTQVSDSSQSLSQGASEQAASLEEITSSVTQLASQTKVNAENAAQANRLSVIAREKAENGNEQILEMTTAMSGISASSKEIAKIIKTIDEIAFQTNLLALNAAVEAARAGKHGKGFAVVAQEVRSLAGRSAKAAQETAAMIEGALKTIDSGSNIVERTAGSLVEIVDGATKASELVAEIARASNEQADGISQINQGLFQVEQVTQQNTASAEETASAVEELSSQASNLRQLVSFFRLDHTEKERRPNITKKAKMRRIEHVVPKLESKNGTALNEKTQLIPEQIIPLDDDNFGKY